MSLPRSDVEIPGLEIPVTRARSKLAHVIPEGVEALVARMLDSDGARADGWLLLGVRVLPDRILAGYKHRSSGTTATVLLVHPSATHSTLVTRRFAILLKSAMNRGEALRLLSSIMESIQREEGSFNWTKIEGDELRIVEAARARECLDACGPPVRDLLHALSVHDAFAADAARARTLSDVSAFFDVSTAVMVSVHVLGAVGLHAEAMESIDHNLGKLSAAAREEVLREKIAMAAALGLREEAVAAVNALVEGARDKDVAYLVAASFHAARHDHERAVELVRRARPSDAAAWVVAAEIFAAAEKHGETRTAATNAIRLAEDDTLVARAAFALGRVGDFDGEERALTRLASSEPAPLPALARLTQLALWRGRYQDAARHAARAIDLAPSDPVALRNQGAAHLFRGHPERALADLAAADVARPGDVETTVLRADALWRLGYAAEARVILERAQSLGGGFGPLEILAGAIRADGGEYGPSYGPFLDDHVARLPVSLAALERLGLTTAPGTETPAATLRRWLDLLRGNRSATLTTCFGDGSLVRLRPEEDSRIDSRMAQELVLTRSADEALARFADVLRRHPHKPYPYCYRGELLVWLGRYDEAREDFLSAIDLRSNTRWAYVGLGAVELFTGHPKRAVETLERGVAIANGPGPTTFAYRGEAHLLLGDHDRAIADLSHACREMPLRVGAWINLALAHGATGARDQQTSIFEQLQGIAAGLLSQACFETGVERAWTPTFEAQRAVLERARGMLRGNRSSTLGTWFDAAGRLRAVLWGPRDPRLDHIEWLRSAVRAP